MLDTGKQDPPLANYKILNSKDPNKNRCDRMSRSACIEHFFVSLLP